MRSQLERLTDENRDLKNEINYQSKTFSSGFKDPEFVKEPEYSGYPQTTTNRSIPITLKRKTSVK